MIVLFIHRRRTHINATAAELILDGDEEIWIGTISKIGLGFKSLFGKEAVRRLEREEIAKKPHAIVENKQLKYFYKIDIRNYENDLLLRYNSFRWIRSKVMLNPWGYMRSNHIYEKILKSMFEKECRGFTSKYSLMPSLFDELKTLAELEIGYRCNSDDMPF